LRGHLAATGYGVVEETGNPAYPLFLRRRGAGSAAPAA